MVAAATYPTIQAGGSGSVYTEAVPAKCSIYIISNTQVIRQAFQRVRTEEVMCDRWAQFVRTWKQTLSSRLQEVKLIWLQMPTRLNYDLGEMLQAVASLTAYAQTRTCVFIMVVKYSKEPVNLWKPMLFRTCKAQQGLTHPKHCVCCHGVRYKCQAYHSRYNIRCGNAMIDDVICNGWSNPETKLDALGAARGGSWLRCFVEKFIRRWCATDQLTGTLQADLQGDLQDDLGAPERTRPNKLDSETSDHSEPPDQPEADGSGSVLTLNLPSPKALWPNLHSQPKLEKGRS